MPDDVIVIKHDEFMANSLDLGDDILQWAESKGIPEERPHRAELTPIRASPRGLNYVEGEISLGPMDVAAGFGQGREVG